VSAAVGRTPLLLLLATPPPLSNVLFFTASAGLVADDPVLAFFDMLTATVRAGRLTGGVKMTVTFLAGTATVCLPHGVTRGAAAAAARRGEFATRGTTTVRVIVLALLVGSLRHGFGQG